jgi:hypothetical protein
MDRYFTSHPEYQSFRYQLPTGYQYLVTILGDRVATGDFVTVPDAESSEEWPMDLPSNDEDNEIQESTERSKSASVILSFPSGSASITSSEAGGSASRDKKKENERKKQHAKENFRKQMADKAAIRGKSREKNMDKLIRSINDIEDSSTSLIREVLGTYGAAQEAAQSPIPRAIKLADEELLKDYSQDDIFRVYDLLEDEAKSHALLAMRAERRAGWLRYELNKARESR